MHPVPKNSTCPHRGSIGKGAFTLIELVVVLAVIAVFFAMTAPQITGVLGSNRITAMGEFVYNKLTQANHLAITEHRDVEVRFYKYADPLTPNSEEHFRSLQFVGWRMDEEDEDEDGATDELIEQALSDVFSLEGNIIISDNPKISTLVSDVALGSGQAPVPKLEGLADYVSFFYRPDGSTSLPLRPGATGEDRVDNQWYLTLVDEIKEATSTTSPPANFYTIQMDPQTGRLTAYRP